MSLWSPLSPCCLPCLFPLSFCSPLSPRHALRLFSQPCLKFMPLCSVFSTSTHSAAISYLRYERCYIVKSHFWTHELMNSWNIFRVFSTVKHSREINSLYQTIFIWHLLICYISIALFWVLRALYIVRGVSPRPPPVCSIHLDDATAAILRQNAHHTTSLLVERRQSDEANQCMGWLRGHDGQRPMGKFGQDARVTPCSFSKDILDFLWPQRVRTSV